MDVVFDEYIFFILVYGNVLRAIPMEIRTIWTTYVLDFLIS